MDEFMLTYVNDLLHSMRTGVALNIVGPYDRVKLGWLGAELGISAVEAETLLAGLILDGRLIGSIDQPNGVLNLGPKHRAPGAHVQARSTGTGPTVTAGSTYQELMSLANRLERLVGTTAQLAGVAKERS